MEYDPLFIVHIFSHHVRIFNIQFKIRRPFQDFAFRQTQMEWVREKGKNVLKPTKLFGTKLYDGQEYRFLTRQWEQLKLSLKDQGYREEWWKEEVKELSHPAPASFPMKEHFKPRDNQPLVINYLLERNERRLKLVTEQPGFGKGFCSISMLAALNVRTVAILKPVYLQKWKEELLEKTYLEEEDIVIIQGSSQLKNIIKLAVDGMLEAKAILISNATYRNFITEYEEDPYRFQESGYRCEPSEFFQKVKAGVLLIDEVHQEFHAIFKALLYTHIHVVVGMSASLEDTNHFLERMYLTAFPREIRYIPPEIVKYIECYSIGYLFRKPEWVRTTERGSNFYSHSAFEESIMRIPSYLKSYQEMILNIAKAHFFDDYQEGDKLMILVARIDFATLICNYFKSLYPHLDVRRYAPSAGDPYENVIAPDIRVAMPGGAGTGTDIPGLTCLIHSVSIFSIKANRQNPGRLRNIQGRSVKYCFLYCKQLPKHVSTHNFRKKVMATHVKSIADENYPYYIG